MSLLTEVRLQHRPKTADDWIRFGRPVSDRIIDRRTSVAAFAPGAIFAYVRWRGGDFGTLSWRLAVLRARDAGEFITTAPGVWPGAEALLATSGEGPVRRAFAVIDRVEAAGVDPAEASPDYWRIVHNRLAAHETPRPYGAAEHASWLVRREILA